MRLQSEGVSLLLQQLRQASLAVPFAGDVVGGVQEGASGTELLARSLVPLVVLKDIVVVAIAISIADGRILRDGNDLVGVRCLERQNYEEQQQEERLIPKWGGAIFLFPS